MKRNILSIHLAAFLFGMTGILGSLIQAEPATITLGRAGFAVLALSLVLARWPFSRQACKPSATATIWPCYLVAGGLLALHWVTFFASVKTAGVAIATLSFSSFAAFITLIEWYLTPASVKRIDWIRLGVVTGGLVLITPTLNIQDSETVGFVMGLASGLSFAAMAVYNSRRLTHVSPIRVARNQNLMVAAVLAVWAWPGLANLGLMSWFWLGVLGVFCTGLSHSLFVYSLSQMRVNLAGLVIALEPVYAIAAAWVLFDQTPAQRTLLGGTLIVCAILGISYVKLKQSFPSNSGGH